MLPLDLKDQPATVYANAVRDDTAGEIILKVVNAGDSPTSIRINLDGVSQVASAATATVLSGSLSDVNTVGQADKLEPVETKLTLPGKSFPHEFPAHSFTVLRVKAG